MYNNNIKTEEFLFILYVKIEQKIKELISLLEKNKNIKNSKEINKIRNNLFEVFDILINNTKSFKLKQTYLYLSNKLLTNNAKDLKIILNFCKISKK